MGYFGTKGSVVHQQHLQIFIISNKEFLKAVGQVELGAAVTAKTYFGHGFVASKFSPDSIVNACISNGGNLVGDASYQSYDRDSNPTRT
jgi:hypothetical protein